MTKTLVYTTQSNVKIYCERGGKSQRDFLVRYQQPGRRLRTIKHVHWVVDLLIKRAVKRDLTNRLVEHLLHAARRVRPAKSFPPKVRSCRQRATRFSALNGSGDYSVEFLLAVVKLLMVQERTNYPYPKMNTDLLEALRKGEDSFRVLGLATLGGR